ncbi:hypothetical protein [Nocardiopsis sp. MG754419]|uniref:hypothetical protein n=1 Tax=Nocardiopsis sp. MG754419 TaxID=2259865 RepID=UPI001BAAE9B9|nr:hypothetical protein [Nocardiopsis sp. MG754419]MBR8744985.1 hypothetical protein [Nocardiopsis sp. MG754419]
MAQNRRTTTSLVALGAFALLTPLAVPGTAAAEPGWLTQDLSSTDRIGLALASGALRLDNVGDLGASPRLDTAERRTGLATFPEQELESATDTVDVAVDTTGDAEEVLTEARGARADGMWTEWYPTRPGGGRVALPEAVTEVQLRVEMSAEGEARDTAVTDVRLRPVESSTPDSGAGGDSDREPDTGPDAVEGTEEEGRGDLAGDDVPQPYSARLFATRIGLVGNTTANGHTVRPDDHFVALPSRRGLAHRGGGEYTVRVCSTGELGPDASGDTENHTPRCAYLPVWDVGPWNITDDHWNGDRESWRDLDRGRPQAQAAYTEGHNSGLDGFGRRVQNPAGIDLADGAFNEGLQLPTNGWVRVDYLWTAEYRERAEISTITQSDPVIVRSGPGSHHDTVGLAAHKANVDVACQVVGDPATGANGTSDVWYRIGEGHYVPAAFADGGSGSPQCLPDQP